MADDGVVGQLERLAQLMANGVLTRAEFDAQKAQILSGRTEGVKPQQGARFSFQSAADTITGGLGLQKIESFSLGHLFSDVFRRHGVDELENLLAVGAPRTTPPLDPSMANFPNPWIFFRAFAVSLLAYGAFYYGLVKFGNVKLLPGFIMIGSFAVPLSVLVLFFEMNTPRNVSAPRVIQFLVVGGSASLLLSLFLYDLSSLSSMFGASAAGVVEECGKLAAVALTLRMAPRGRYPWRLNALLFGAAVGTGFAAFESAGYALERALSGGDMLGNIAVRGFLSPFGHIVWTAIAAAALWGAQREGGLLSLQFLRLFAIPVALHFIWNLDFDLPFFGKELILGFIAWVVVISLVQTGLKEIAVAATPTGATQGVKVTQ
jgi:RsiW-degrading membrane proteinase PrsW (M82 family)